MKKKLVIFDLDGTILDTLEDLTDATNYALSVCHFPKRTKEEVRNFVGNGILKLAERAVPEGTDRTFVLDVYKAFGEYYRRHCLDKTQVYPGVPDLMKALRAKGCLLAVVSNKADYGVQQLCHKFFDGLFDFAVGEREGVKKKPSPDAVLEVLEALHIAKQDAVYIGDSEVDVATAKNAGMDCLTVTWGFRDRAFLAERGAKHFAERPEEVLEYLADLKK